MPPGNPLLDVFVQIVALLVQVIATLVVNALNPAVLDILQQLGT